MAKAADPRPLALQALSRAVADPTPKVLFGSKTCPGFFTGSAQAAKQAAQHCRDQGWLEPTGQFEGKGKNKKELFRITPGGLKEALANSEAVTLLGDAKDYLVKNENHLASVKTTIEQTLAALQQQRELVGSLQARLKPPDLDRLLQGARSEPSAAARPSPDADWASAVQAYLRDYRRRHPLAHCPLPELFHAVAEPRALTIGQFHDGLRRLVEKGQVRLHAFTGAAYTLQEDHLALVAGQEIKYYAESIASS